MGCCGHCNGPTVSTKCSEFLDSDALLAFESGLCCLELKTYW